MFLKHVAESWGEDHVEGFKSPWRNGTQCFRCNALTRPDGGKLLVCAFCKRMHYCSVKCQVSHALVGPRPIRQVTTVATTTAPDVPPTARWLHAHSARTGRGTRR